MSIPLHQAVSSEKPLELFADLPHQPSPRLYPVNFYELVPLILNDHPDWSEEDIIELVEEKTRQPIHPKASSPYERCTSDIRLRTLGFWCEPFQDIAKTFEWINFQKVKWSHLTG